MSRVLVIDDDPVLVELFEKGLQKRGYEVIAAFDAVDGLNKISSVQPDIIILDILMPGMDGIEVARRLRSDSDFAHVPILIISALSQTEQKVEAFRAGADDFMTKPFDMDEVAARLSSMLRRTEAIKVEGVDRARTIAVHSLRGGIGCSTVATNLAYALAKLWQMPTLLMDLDFNSGQVALMLNGSDKRNWSDIVDVEPGELDLEILQGIISRHESGLHYMAAPRNPIDAQEINEKVLSSSITLLKRHYAYVVTDVAHNFRDSTLEVLENADSIVLLTAPDIVSIRAAVDALSIYKMLDFGPDKVKLVLNYTTTQSGLDGKQIEKGLNYLISQALPYAPRLVVGAINSGVPFLGSHPKGHITAQIEDLAFQLSKKTHQEIPPPAASETWQRVNARRKLFGNGSSIEGNRKPFMKRLRDVVS